MNSISKLWQYRELLYMVAWRDVRIRYKQSVMGFLWAILMPSLIVGAGILVRVGGAKYTGSTISFDDIASVMVRAVAWSFFIAGIRFGTNSLLANATLVTKIAFPKEVFPVAATLSSLFDFVIATAAVLLTLVVMGWVPTAQAFWGLLLLVMLVMLTTGLALLLSAANLFFRDVKYIVEIMLTYAIFFTPVLYEASVLGKWRTVVMLNPMAPILEGLADTMVYGRPPELHWIAYSFVVSAATLLFGYWLFKQLEPKFAESI